MQVDVRDLNPACALSDCYWLNSRMHSTFVSRPMQLVARIVVQSSS